MHVGMAGVIYAAIVVVWAAYLVPLWLRRHDEEASAERFSSAMRVLARRRPAIMIDPVEGEPVEFDEGEHAVKVPAPPRLSPATRRRRALVALLVPTTVSLALSAVDLMPWWVVGGFGALVAGFLVLSAMAARRDREAVRAPRLRAYDEPPAPEQPDESSMVPAEPATMVAELPDDFVAPAPEPDEDRWDPVEVPLPTYVTKAKAEPPTSRRIELGDPDPSAMGGPVLDESDREPTGIRDEVYDRDESDRRAVGD